MVTVAKRFPKSYLALPKTDRGKGVLVLHAWWGLNDFIKEFCERLAREGFVALAPDLYRGNVATTIAKAKYLRGKTKRAQVGADILSAVEQLRGLPTVTGDTLGVVGFSWGANWAFWLSVGKPALIGAVTVFYGTKTADYSRTKAAYLGHFAKTDPFVSTSSVRKLEQRLRADARPAIFHTYEGTGHWFFETDRHDAYDAKAAQLAWNRTVEFLLVQLADSSRKRVDGLDIPSKSTPKKT